MQEPKKTQVCSLGQEDPLEAGMATHSNIPAWRISWTEEAGGRQSMGSPESDATEYVCILWSGNQDRSLDNREVSYIFLSFCFLNCWLLFSWRNNLGYPNCMAFQLFMFQSLFLKSLKVVTEISCYPK